MMFRFVKREATSDKRVMASGKRDETSEKREAKSEKGSLCLLSSVFRPLSSVFWICLLSSVLCPLYSHHTGTTHDPKTTTRFVDPFTGKREKPAGYMVLTQDYYKATNENSNVYTTTAFAELPFWDGQFAMNISVPWTYFQQKDRGDAARIGKSYIGGKWLPFADFEKNYFLMVEGNIGFPSGPDTDRFTGGNYYSGQGLLTLGYLYNQWSFILKGGGVQPLTRSRPSNLQDNDGIPFWLRPTTAEPPSERYELKKATIIQGYVTYLFRPEWSFFVGYLYRTPFQGVDFDRETEDTIPRIFQEASMGFTYNFSERYNLVLAYRYPTYRKSDHRLYESAWTIAFSMEFNGSDENKSNNPPNEFDSRNAN